MSRSDEASRGEIALWITSKALRRLRGSSTQTGFVRKDSPNSISFGQGVE